MHLYSITKGVIQEMARKKQRNRKWTPEEEQRLIKLCEKDSQTEIARKMKLSVASIKGKRIQMNIDCYSDQTDKLNVTQISELVGVQKNSITRTWIKYGFPIKKQGLFSVVSENELCKFMQEHLELWKAADCDYYFFQRFDWFIERLEREKVGKENISHYRNRKSWTELDISRFKMLKSRGLTHNQIALELGRTRSAVDHMNMRLNGCDRNVI